jgi:hypothetical protein
MMTINSHQEMIMTLAIQELWVDKQQINKTRLIDKTIPSESLEKDQVVLEIESFGFSANNITYASMGEQMKYWGFFPADEGWGKVPVWGYGVVVASNHLDVPMGEKYFGYFPMATHLLITADKVNQYGLRDCSPWRVSNSPVYDNYSRCATDISYKADQEAWDLNFRPLYITSFILDDYLNQIVTSDVSDIVFTSASSKTAYGAAFLMKTLKEERGLQVNIIGSTSKGNVEFVETLGCFDKVVAYDSFSSLSEAKQSWLVDFAGNAELVNQYARQSGRLARVIQVGATDWQNQTLSQGLSDEAIQREFFFAPSHVAKRREEWGAEAFNQAYAKAWLAFAKHIKPLLDVKEVNGVEDVEALYQSFLNGNVDVSVVNHLRMDC